MAARLSTSVNISVEFGLTISIPRLDKDIDIVLEASVMKEHRCGEAVVSSRRNHDIEEQETGVELVSKLPRIVSIANYAQGRPAQRESFILRL